MPHSRTRPYFGCTRFTARFLTALTLCAALTACAGFSSNPPFAQQVEAIDSLIAELSSKGAIKSDEQQSLDLANSQLWFPAVAGHLYGTPTIDLKWKPVQSESQFSIEGKQLEAELAKNAKAFDGRETGIFISPEATRIARVVPFLLGQFDGEPIGQSDWLNPVSKRRLMLVYFDRPCRVIGSLFKNQQEVRFDIEIPASGLYWLEERKGWFGPSRYINGSAPRQTVLAIQKSQ